MKNIEKYKDIVLDNVDACSIDDNLHKMNASAYCEGYNCEECKERFLKWLLEEAKEPVLDELERKYLADVIRPFRKEVATISKFNSFDGSQYIYIGMKDSRGSNLPCFPKGTMYRGMIDEMHYSLKELGL